MNIVRASNVHVCVQYGIILANYVMDVAISVVIRAETLECSLKIARLCRTIFSRSLVIQVYQFWWVVGPICWHHAKAVRRFANF